MIIRQVHTSDIPELSEVARKTYSETFGHTMSQEYLDVHLEATRSESYFNRILEKDEIIENWDEYKDNIPK